MTIVCLTCCSLMVVDSDRYLEQSQDHALEAHFDDYANTRFERL